MAIQPDKPSLLQLLIAKIRSNGVGGLTRAVDVREFLVDLIDTMESWIANTTGTADINLAWDNTTIYGTSTNQFAIYGNRIYKSKVENNQGNVPPTVPDATDIYQDAYWIEVSEAPASNVRQWQAGIYKADLNIVYNAGALYYLDPATTLPYESANFGVEQAAGIWKPIAPDPLYTPADPTFWGASIKTVKAALDKVATILKPFGVTADNRVTYNGVKLLTASDLADGSDLAYGPVSITNNVLDFAAGDPNQYDVYEWPTNMPGQTITAIANQGKGIRLIYVPKEVINAITFDGANLKQIGVDLPGVDRTIELHCLEPSTGVFRYVAQFPANGSSTGGGGTNEPDAELFELNKTYTKGDVFRYQFRLWITDVASFTSLAAPATLADAMWDAYSTGKIKAAGAVAGRPGLGVNAGAATTSTSTLNHIDSEKFFVDVSTTAASHTHTIQPLTNPVKFSPLYISVRKQVAGITLAFDPAQFPDVPADTSTDAETVRYAFEVDGNGVAKFLYKGGFVPAAGITNARDLDYTQAADSTALDGAYSGKLAVFLNRLYTYVISAFNKRVDSIAFTGTTTKTLTITRQDGTTLTANFTDNEGTGGTGATTLNELTDVDTATTPPTDGQALVYDSVNSIWKPGSVSGGSTTFASTAEEEAGTITNKAATPGGRSSWFAKVLDGTITAYFSSKLAAFKIELGNALAAGTERIIEAVGSVTDIAITLKPKGAGKVKLIGASYVVAGQKVLILNAAGEVIAEYDVTDEQVAVPTSLSAAGIAGTWATEPGFLYFCTGPSWEKFASVSDALSYGEFATAAPTTTTNPAGAFVGQIAYDVAAGRKYEWTGSQWVWTAINTTF